MYRTSVSLAALAMLASTAGAAQAEIQVGVVTAVTGSMASFGEQMRSGVEAAAKEINAKGGINGEEIGVKVYDDACDPKQGVSAANQIVNDGIRFVIGHMCTGPSVPASDVYSEEGIVMISPTATAPVLTERGLDNVFRVAGRDDQQGQVAADHIAAQIQNPKVAIIHDKQAYGSGLADATAKRLAEKGIQPVMTGSVNPGESDFSALVTKMKSEGVNTVYFGGYHAEAGQIVRQMGNAGMDAVLVAGDGLSNPDFWAITGESGAGTLFTFSPDPTANPTAAPVIEQLRADGIDPAFFTLYSYAALQVLAQGIEAAGEPEPDAVADALREGTFDTVIGPLDFDDKGDLTEPAYVMYSWQDGKYGQVSAR
ncbi:ABC transporter substrate-binding protein [Skermanella sp. TT6]|uniref:ABC transporter substrate-binding protein n=1 Tax=Skermanella cutis TaxID=2775420 RepID=A0ABX7B259_9PROT|nr:ABC transporter substrate-binding protein [Skermanella sp. TT6]QQP87749.1 ABC transporter substrate-binding protein [Skermanella sp. TT6]